VTDFSADGLRAAELFDRTYRDTTIVSLGGPLEGTVRLGTDGMWRTAEGLEVFRCGHHPTLQAAVVAAVDGRIGSSWTWEFTPLFDSVDLFVANAAAWNELRNWRYVAVGDVPLDLVRDLVVDMSVDAAATGALTAWWRAPDHVVTAQQRVNPGRGPHPDVSVLARTHGAAEELRRRLAAAGAHPSLFTAADVRGTSGHGG
jgi:hypothetical protein